MEDTGVNITFDELIGLLPTLTQAPFVEQASDALTVLDSAPANFVRPSFQISSWPDGARVVVIEAAGAVGKSITSAALAASLHWPLVSSEKAQVGSYTLTGLVTDSLGFNDYLSKVKAGSAGLVIDALDEAQLKAGFHNFVAFLGNITSILGTLDPEGGPSFVLMARSDTAESVCLHLDEAEVSYAQLKLAFFDHEASMHYVENYHDARALATNSPEYRIRKASPKPFEQLLSLQFRRLMAALGSDTSNSGITRENWRETEEFLGYAPVLTVLAEAIACTNPSSELQKLKQASPDSNTAMLIEICESILVREQDKFLQNFLPKMRALQPAEDESQLDAHTIYSPLEQLVRVFALVTGSGLAAVPPATLPDSVRAIYEDAAGGFVLDHPFVRQRGFASVVFQDFILARLLGDVGANAYLEHAPLSVSPRVGAFFYDFYRARSRDVDIEERFVLALVSSWKQALELRSERGGVLVHLEDEVGLLMLARDTDGAADSGDMVAVHSVSDVSGAFQLPMLMRDWTIYTSQGVILGSKGGLLTVGSGCTLVANEVEILSEGIAAETMGSHATSQVIALSVRGDFLRSIAVDRDHLTIHSADLPPVLYPLSTSRIQMPKRIPYGDFVALRAILLAFHRTVHHGMCASAEAIDRLAPVGSFRRTIVSTLIDREVVELEDGWYQLQQKNLAAVGFSLQDLKSGQPSEAVLKFLSDCRS